MRDLFPTLVYVLCFLTSAACAWLLGRSYRRSGVRLLLWSTICFLFLAGNNLMLVIDLLLIPQVDLRIARLLLSLAAISVLIYAFIWELDEQ
ncbi:MAG TPA: DUF5985 family protein [Sphingomicrobium sp.]|nr:DUF5985 family protein [Sphingomicrobium sp.]